MDTEKQKTILNILKNKGGQVSVGYLGELLGSKVLSGRKTGIDAWKHNLQLLLDGGMCRETGVNLGITSSLVITQKGYDFLLSSPTSEVINTLKNDYPKIISTVVSLIKLIKEFLIK